MKKILAIFLSALILCISLVPMCAAAVEHGLTNRVIEDTYSPDASPASTVKKTTFTLVVKAPRGIKNLIGAVLFFEYDPAVLSVAKGDVAGVVDADGNAIPNFNGIAVNGIREGTKNQYSIGWTALNGVSKNGEKDFAYITFNVLDTTKTQTAIRVYADEFRTDDGNTGNDITETTLLENVVVNFDFPENTPPATTTETSSENGSNGEGTTTEQINTLLQLIRDMLKGNGVTFADLADAIANVLGNAEITDIVEQLVDGKLIISDAFKDFLESLGIDLGQLEDILNKIIDFIKGLFGKDDTAVNTTAAAADTTAAGSSSESEKTGDMGVALAATICVLSSAAFVLTQKKKNII